MDRHPSLYERDILAWSEEQAAVLRRLKDTRRDLPNDLDLENIVEEIESVGLSERKAVANLILQMFVHLLKIACEPQCDAVRHWRVEILNFQAQAQSRFTPSMRQHLDMDALWAKAHSIVGIYAETADAEQRLALLESCPLSLDDIVLDDGGAVRRLVAQLQSASGGAQA